MRDGNFSGGSGSGLPWRRPYVPPPPWALALICVLALVVLSAALGLGAAWIGEQLTGLVLSTRSG